MSLINMTDDLKKALRVLKQGLLIERETRQKVLASLNAAKASCTLLQEEIDSKSFLLSSYSQSLSEVNAQLTDERSRALKQISKGSFPSKSFSALTLQNDRISGDCSELRVSNKELQGNVRKLQE